MLGLAFGACAESVPSVVGVKNTSGRSMSHTRVTSESCGGCILGESEGASDTGSSVCQGVAL